MFGTTEKGGANGDGTIFSINTDGTGYQVLYSFGASTIDGEDPTAGLTLDGSTLFGTTDEGGNFPPNQGVGGGTVFSIRTDGTGYTVLHSFTDTETVINDTVSGLTLDGSTLYGTTATGGDALGCIFSINTDGSNYQILHAFASPVDRGGYPGTGLTLDGSTLYGTTTSGGANGAGSIFSIRTDGSDYQVLYSFTNQSGISGLTLVGSTLYGTANGTVISINTDGTGFQRIPVFSGYPYNGYYINDFTGSPVGDVTLVGSTLYGSTSGGFPGGFFSVSDVTDYNVGGPAAAFDQGLTVSLDPDSTDLSGATVAISASTLEAGDLLNFTNQNGVSGNYSHGVLTLTGRRHRGAVSGRPRIDHVFGNQRRPEQSGHFHRHV